MNCVIGLVYAMATTSALVGTLERIRLDQRINASQALALGDTKDQVRDRLGPPLREWEHAGLFLPGPPRWGYGVVFEPRDVVNADGTLPVALPIKIRLFGPDESDLIIEWDEGGRIARISRP